MTEKLSPSTTLRIFVAEDDLDDQFLLRDAFDQFAPHIELLFFTNGYELLYTLGLIKPDSKWLPNLIVTDLNMPKIDGYGVIEGIQTHPHLGTLPVAVLTTAKDSESHQRSISLGAIAFWSKPRTMAEFQEIVKQLLVLLNTSK